MSIFEKVSEQEFRKILWETYKIGEETSNIELFDIIEIIKIKMLIVSHSSKE